MQEQLKAWDESQVSILPKQERRREKPRLLVSVSLVLLIGSAVVIGGVSIWASMYSLNLQGYSAFSAVVMNQTARNVALLTNDFCDNPIESVQVFEEQLRVDSQVMAGMGIGDLAAWRTMAWAQAKQESGCFVGLPDGSMWGYRLRDYPSPEIVWLNTTAPGRLESYTCDYYGHQVSLIDVDLTLNATTQPWYAGAVDAGGFFLTSAYTFFGTDDAGLTAAITLYADLQPPRFSNGLAPFVAPNGPIPAVRKVLGVVAIDLPLQNVSLMLQSIIVGTSNRSMIWYFDPSANFIAISNTSIPTNNRGKLIKTTDVNNALFNATMAYLLTQTLSGVPISPSEYSAYGNISTFNNRMVSLSGETWILTCQTYQNRDQTFSWYLVIIVPSSDFYAQASYANMVSLIIIFIVILPILVLAAAIFSVFCLARPMRELAHCMSQITTDFKFYKRNMAISPVSEIQVMQMSYDSMEPTLRSFSKFAPAHTVQKLLQSKSVAKLGVNEVQATMFFSDIEGFTSISERVDAQELIMSLQEYFDAMTEIIQQRSGTVGDFIGDAVFAFWNAPIRSERHAYMAVDAAVAQQEALVRLRADWEARGLPPFNVRMGVNTGQVLAGNVGSRSRLKYTLIGDAVNLAARMEGVGKSYGCYITLSESTFKSAGVREAFVCRPLDVVTVVGKKEPTVIYTVIARRADATSSDLQLEKTAEQMIGLYQRGELRDCLSLLNQMITQVPSTDKSVKRLITKCENVLKNGGPPPDWNGVTAMTEK